MDNRLPTFDWKRSDALGLQVQFPGRDLTGAAIKFTGKLVPDDAGNDAAAQITVDYVAADIPTISDAPTTGICVVVVDSTKTNVAPGAYYCDVEAQWSPTDKLSIPTFIMNIVRDITRR